MNDDGRGGHREFERFVQSRPGGERDGEVRGHGVARTHDVYFTTHREGGDE